MAFGGSAAKLTVDAAVLSLFVSGATANSTLLDGPAQWITESGTVTLFNHNDNSSGLSIINCTGRTVSLGGRGSSPFLDAVEVEDVEAALAAPHRGHVADDVTAHHALVLLLRQLFNQTPCGPKGVTSQAKSQTVT